MSNSMELTTLYFAALLINAVAVPIDPDKGDTEIKKLLSRIDHKLVVFDSDDALMKQFRKSINIAILAQKSSPTPQEKTSLILFQKINYNQVFLITFTSGSTAEPKAVMHSMKNLVFNERFGLRHKTFYHNLPMTYMAGILNLIILPFISSSTIVIDKKFTIDKIKSFWNNPIKHHVDTFWFVPTIISLLNKLDRSRIGTTYLSNKNITIFVGTAPLTIKAKKEFELKYNTSLYESYGLSETLFLTTNYPNHNKEGTIGIPLKNVQLVIDQKDEIFVQAPWMFLGYHRHKAKIDKFYTGDLAKKRDDGYIEIFGRKKNLIIRGGVNINPKRIEDVLEKYSPFEEIAVLGIEDDILGEKITCFYVYNSISNRKINLFDLNQSLMRELGKEYRIDEYYRIKEIPRNSNGKLYKEKLKSMYKPKNVYQN